MNKTFLNISRVIFSLTLSSIYAIIAAGQVLGFLKIYRLAIVLPFTILVFLLVFYLYWRSSALMFLQFSNTAETKIRWADISFGTAGVALLVVCILIPVINWPYTPIYDTLSWDVGLYHLPKAVEMIKTGSAWDLSIAYGEYPFGYESILAFPALITQGRLGFGPLHALTDLFFLLSFWLLLRRFSNLPGGVSLFLVAGISLSGYFPQIDSNLWWFYISMLNTIGKNDLFVAACLLAVILHTPLGKPESHKFSSLTGMALASMIALSVKPNAALIVLPLWIYVLVRQIIRREFPKNYLNWMGYAFIIAPGILWAVRNLAAQGKLFSRAAQQLQTLSIAANLTNPNLLNHLPQHLIVVAAIIAVALLCSIFIRHFHWTIPLLAVLLLIGFALTPTSGFFPDTNRPADIAWRFAAALMAVIFIIPFVILSPWINRIYTWINRIKPVALITAALAIGFAGWFILGHLQLNETNVDRAIVLRDQFQEPVGINGYYSAYDYVQKNGSDSVVWVENGLPYYAYGDHFSNSVTRSKQPEYMVIFQTAWHGGETGYPDYIKDPTWHAKWRLVYEDREGRVYLRQADSP